MEEEAWLVVTICGGHLVVGIGGSVQYNSIKLLRQSLSGELELKYTWHGGK